jgi:hypothetical protein
MSFLFVFFILFWSRFIVRGASVKPESGSAYYITNNVTGTVIDLSGGGAGVQ